MNPTALRRLLSTAVIAQTAVLLHAAPRGESTPIPATGDARLDTLLVHLNQQSNALARLTIGTISIQAYVRGTSRCTRSNWTTRYGRNVLPFETSANVSAFEAKAQASYAYPHELRFETLALRSNNRRAGRQLREVYQMLLPIYALKKTPINGGRTAYVFPFSADGVQQYTYAMTDTVMPNGERLSVISFQPRKKHHSLLSGSIILSPVSLKFHSINIDGLIDFGKVSATYWFGTWHGFSSIRRSHIRISYNYSGSEGVNEYDCDYTYRDLTTLSDEDRRHPNYDLTEAYRIDPAWRRPVNFDTIRPTPLPVDLATQLQKTTTGAARHERKLYEKVPELLIKSSEVDAFGTNLKIYGPLEPAAFGYDHRNGITLRERLRWSHVFKNGQSALVQPEAGYSFKLSEWRYSLDAEWVHHPERRQGLRLHTQKRSSGFSSKFQETVNDALAAKDSVKVDFDNLGIEYYDNYTTRLEHSFELMNGLMLYGGVDYSYRVPVRHGQRALPQAYVDSLVKDHYADFVPYLRLVWTPRQYYRRAGRQKLYLEAPCPTFELMVSRGFKHLLGSDTDFGLMEFDVHQAIRLDPQRTLSFHAGGGVFLRQKGVYFIDYHYFSRSQYPDTWDERSGSTFTLLEDYWFNSSPAYAQSHVMYDTPFMLLHNWRWLSRYIIRERVYVSSLWADGKPPYGEIGYGFGNNYFSVAGYAGFTQYHKFYDFGLKASIVIDQHW